MLWWKYELLCPTSKSSIVLPFVYLKYICIRVMYTIKLSVIEIIYSLLLTAVKLFCHVSFPLFMCYSDFSYNFKMGKNFLPTKSIFITKETLNWWSLYDGNSQNCWDTDLPVFIILCYSTRNKEVHFIQRNKLSQCVNRK